MPFSIHQNQSGGLNMLVLRDEDRGTEVRVLPEYGALLHAFIVETADGPMNLIDNYKDAADLQQHLSMSYKGARLSPFPCRIAGAKYEYNGHRYEFTKKFTDGSAIHGLLFNKAFAVTGQHISGSEAAATLRYHYKRDDPGYPFDYMCEVQYVLKGENELQVRTTVINHDTVPIPIADGWHPYFRLGGKVDEWQMQFGTDKMLEFSQALIPTGRLTDDASFKKLCPIGDRKLDNCFLLPPSDGTPCCILYHPKKDLGLHFYVDDRYRYLQVYIPGERESIAIENLSAAPDSFNNGMGLVTLAPRGAETFNLWYKVSMGQNE